MESLTLGSNDGSALAARLCADRGAVNGRDCCASAPRRVERISPAEVRAKRIGHFGFFRDQFQSSLWARSVALLQGFHIQQETTA